jgi:adenylate cyclase
MSRRIRFLGLGLEGALAILLTLCLAFAALALRDNPTLDAIEGRTLDWRLRIRGPLAPSPDIAMVVVDDRTLDVLGRWPVSRAWLARAVEAAAADGAAVIAFDLIFVGPEREPDADAALRAAIADFGKVVVPFAFLFTKSQSGTPGLPPVLERAAYAVVHEPAGLSSTLRPFPTGLLMPESELLAAGVPAHVSVILDADGILRRMEPVIGYGGAYFPALHVAAARLFLGLSRSEVAVSLGEGVQLGPRRIATEADMRLPINHLGPEGQVPSYSLIDLVEGRIPAGTLRGRAVLIGATAQGVGDRFATAFGQNLPGVEVFAAALDNLLEGRSLERSLRTTVWDLLAVLVCGLLAAALAWQRAALLTLAGGAAIVLAWGALCTAALIFSNLWLSFVPPALAASAGVVVISAAQILRERRTRQSLEHERAGIARFISPLVGTRATRGHVAVMFVDLRGFTSAAEDMAPERTMALMRAFHGRVEDAVARHRGKIDKFIGDGALALFGTEGPDADAAKNALLCARDLADAVAAWAAEVSEGEAKPRVGIGIHLGPVALGEVGGAAYAQMTVAGDTVNVASRLEALTRSHDAIILASDAAVESARAAGAALDDFVELPMQAIRGRRRPLGAWAWPAPGQDLFTPS